MEHTIYVVTGAAGHLGSHIISSLRRQGLIVRGLILPAEPPLVQDSLPELTYFTGDVIVHPFGIIGPTKRPTGSLMHMIANFSKKGMPVAVRGGYDFVDVRDVAIGVIGAAKKGHKGECYILSGRLITLQELFIELSKAAGQKKPRLFLPPG